MVLAAALTATAVHAQEAPADAGTAAPLAAEAPAAAMGTGEGDQRGAAALDLAWVAAGRFDGFWERNLRSWDLAAGIVILREAGGFVTDLAGKDGMLENGSVVAGNEAIHRQLLKQLKTAHA